MVPGGCKHITVKSLAFPSEKETLVWVELWL